MKNNINKKEIRNSCLLCGNCYVVCPKHAISFDNKNEKVIVNKNLCINCGLCVKNCPTVNSNKSQDLLFGNILAVYAGYSNDETIRYKSASGGVLTQILKYLIENNIVDKVLITDFESDVLQANSYFSNDIIQIINACGSKYQIVNVNKSLTTVFAKNLRYAYVGLPCHHKGLEKLMENNRFLRERIIYKFSICCSHNCNIKILDYVAHYFKIKEADIKYIKYRGDGWPEYLCVTTQNDVKLKFPIKIWNSLFSSFFYTPKQCLNCDDFCGETSDISFADAWIEEYLSSKSSGFNLVFSHNLNGEELLRRVFNANEIMLISRSINDIINSQVVGLFYKKYLNRSFNISSIILRKIIKINSHISKLFLFKYLNNQILWYYFHIINFFFMKRNILNYKRKLQNENTNSKSTYL